MSEPGTASKTFRLPTTLIARIEAIAKDKHVTFSAAHRFAVERGVALLEREAQGPEGGGAAPRRRVLSRGVLG